MSKWTSICHRCRRVYAKNSSIGPFCFSCTKEEHERQESLKSTVGRVRTCKGCGKEFNPMTSSLSRSYCSDLCRYGKYADRGENKKEYVQSKIDNANKRWIEDKPKNKGKKVPIDELIKRSEYKRVFDDKGWDHYLKGRKYDKI